MNNEVPVALMIFNRPDLTKLVMEQLSKIKPPILYVLADGARNEEEQEKCKQTRKIALNPNWACKVVPFFRDRNAGMVRQFKEGLDFVFEKHDRLLFLEDDHIISKSTYAFVSELLELYAEEDRISHINLSNLAPHLTYDSKYSYFFSSHFSVWGFATWRRMWNTYDISMPEWSSSCNKGEMLDINCCNRREKKGIRKMFDLHSNNKEPWTYDYQWVFNCYNRNTLSITPKNNLCLNIGFERQDATHNKGKNPFVNPIEETEFPLQHPQSIIRNTLFDKKLSSIKCPSKIERTKNRIQAILSSILKVK